MITIWYFSPKKKKEIAFFGVKQMKNNSLPIMEQIKKLYFCPLLFWEEILKIKEMLKPKMRGKKINITKFNLVSQTAVWYFERL